MLSDILRSQREESRVPILAAMQEIHRVIVGMEEPIESFFIALFSGGHYLIEGRPGNAKTKFIKAAARVCGLSVGRVQGQPTLTPDDVLGRYLEAREGDIGQQGGLRFYPGPIFRQLLHADEVNRIPPKTQAAFLEGAEEFQVTTPYGEIFPLPNPFILAATQNPREEGGGVFPLTHANLDRFALSDFVTYPSEQQEGEVLSQDDREPHVTNLEQKLSADRIIAFRDLIKECYPADSVSRVKRYIVRLCRATRPDEGATEAIPSPSGTSFPFSEVMVSGVSTRAVKLLGRAARVYAFLHGAEEVEIQHVRHVAERVLSHRLILVPGAEMDGFTSRYIVRWLLGRVPEVAEVT